MAKPVRTIVTPKWQKIKAMYEAGTNGSDKYGTNFEIEGELDMLCHEFIDMVGEITQDRGFDCVVEDIKMDLWKERIWTLIQNAGLLEEIAWKTDKESDKVEEDEWHNYKQLLVDGDFDEDKFDKKVLADLDV